MGHLIISFFAALAVAISVYMETASVGLALLAYAAAGSVVLLTTIFASSLSVREDKIIHAE